MRIIEGFDFFPLTFDDRGQLESRQEFDLLTDRAKTVPATDAIFIAHGFRNDVTDATTLYTAFPEDLQGPPVASGVPRRRGTTFRRGRGLLAVEAVSRDLRHRRGRHPRTS